MARCCDPREELTGTVKLEYKIGGMKSPDSDREVIDTMNQIDGVQSVKVDQRTQKLTISYDPGKVTQDHLISTLNSLGHSVLNENDTGSMARTESCPLD